MPRKDMITMSVRELKRVKVIHRFLNKEIDRKKASELLQVSVRQIGRMARRVLEEGDAGIIHKSRGRESNRKLPEELVEKVLKIYREKYWDFGPTLANEKLCELDKINISNQTLRNWLIEKGIWERKRKVRIKRQWRERKEHRGEMIQMDGSHHDWLEGRGPELVLMAYIDDATSTVYARFYDYEGTFPAMDSFMRYMERYGLPQSVYLDRHSTCKSTAKTTIEDELENKKHLSQFERAMEELAVRVIHAGSPQGKGRVERLFRTFQDRVIKEMRLKGISTKEEANKFLRYYLPIYNKKFGRTAAKQADLHRTLPEGINIHDILCIKTKRALRNDTTVAHNKKLYQVLNRADTKQVIVKERVDGTMLTTHNGVSLNYKEIFSRNLKEKQPTQKQKAYKPKKKYIPPKDHPWRNNLSSKIGHF